MISLDTMMVCAPNVAPTIMERVIHAESRDSLLVLNVNVKWVIGRDEKGQSTMVTGKDGQPKSKRCKVVFKWPIEVKTKQDVVTVTCTAMAGGFTVDMSCIQVNSSNLSVPGFTVEGIFDDCKSLVAGASILSTFYARALKEYPDLQTALRVALSAYSTGDFNKSHLDGYLARYGTGNPAVSVPAINSYTVDMTVLVRRPPKKEEVMSTKEEVSSMQQIVGPAKAVAPRVDPVVSQSQEDGVIFGVQAEHTVDAVEANGVFHEIATSESDTWGSSADSADDPSGAAVTLKGKVVRPAAPRSTVDLAKAQPVKGGN